MNSREVEIKVKFDYEGQKRAILLPLPLKYRQLIKKLRELCGSKFTVEYSAAKGEFIREIDCQEDLDDVICLTKTNLGAFNCLPLRLVQCSSSDCLRSIAGNSQVSLCSSLSSAHPKDSGGFFFHSEELPGVFHAPVLGKTNADYIPETENTLQSVFIPDSSDIQSFTSCGYNAKNWRDSKKQMSIAARNSSKNNISAVEMNTPPSQDRGRQQSRVEIFHPDDSRTESPAGNKLPPMVNTSTESVIYDGARDGQNADFTPGRWVKGRLLGQGAFGQVFSGYDVNRGVEFAVKQVQIDTESREVKQQIEALEMEISILQGVHHDHVVEYYGMQRQPDCLSIFMEFIPMGSLKDHINRYGCLTERVTALYTNQVLKGLTYLHSKMIIHRDIKCANILRDHRGNLKLGDFGASKLLQSQSVAATSKLAGTPYFMAPEMIRGDACGCRCDIWSLGCTVVEMLTKNPPWHQYDAIAAIYKIGSTWPPEYSLPDETSDCVKHFLDLCFAEAAVDRPKAPELLSHDFMAAALQS